MESGAPLVGPVPRGLARVYHGWFVVLVAAAAMVGTLPARTQGLGLITEPLLHDLGLSRVAYAEINLWATLIGATFAIGIGRVLDRFGGRVVLAAVAAALGAVVCLMSRARSTAALFAWITLTRGIGQSALSVISIAMVGHWFVRKLERAMATYSIVTTVGFMLAFPLAGALVQRWGWRWTWFALGAALLAGLVPLALLVVRRGPEACGLAPDGDESSERRARADQRDEQLSGHAWSAALRTPAFWVFALGGALYGLVASGIALFNESVLAERGFGPEVYYQTLVVTACTGLAGNFLGGWLAGRVRLQRLLALALVVLAAGLVALPFVTTLAQVMVWASAMGVSGGLMMVLFFGVWPRVYGRRALGRIQGSAQALTVLASALGPLVLAWCVERTGSYRAMFEALALVTVALAAASLAVRIPPPAGADERVAPEA